MNPEDVIHFWFTEAGPDKWWTKSAVFDDQIRRRFQALHAAAHAGELAHWRVRSRGRLAEVIVLDQFSRNIYRDDARAFASDAAALVLAQEAIAQNKHHAWPAAWRSFLYMPFMHSESPHIHEQAVILFSEPGMDDNLKFEFAHKRIIDRFGRYPHRNDVLGRASTEEERAFLQEGGSSF